MRALPGRVVMTATLLASGVTLTLGSGAPAAAAFVPVTSTLTVLDGVSCISRATCTAIGYSDTAPPTTTALAERWTGRKWAIQRAPSPRGGAHLYGLSCTSRTFCSAVGYNLAFGTSVAERWNGTKWAIQRTPI